MLVRTGGPPSAVIVGAVAREFSSSLDRRTAEAPASAKGNLAKMLAASSLYVGEAALEGSRELGRETGAKSSTLCGTTCA